MPSIVGKKQGNKTYYYLVESARVGGKPRIVSQVYLGSAEEIADRLSGVSPGEPDRIREASFGALAGVWSVIERLRIAEIIDEVVGARRSDAGASVGTYIALAVANRVVAPRSKLAFGEWWATTVGPRLVRLPDAALDHRRFWDAMDYLSAEDLAAAEEAICQAMVAEFDLDLSGLVLDMTNFATFVDSANARNTIAQRGHAKQKRTDLRLVGLALTVTRDGGVPIYSHAYEGNRPDVTQFAEAVKVLAARFRDSVGTDAGLTVVYDAGCDSTENQELIEAASLHFVGSLVVTNHPDLLAIPASEYRSLERKGFPGLTYHETRATALGKQRRVIVTHSADFHDAQVRGLEQSLAKARRRLSELAARLGRGNTRRERPAVDAEIATILKDDRVGRVIRTTLTGQKPANLRLSWRSDATARRHLEAEIFGKRILFTDHEDWPVADVVAAYRSQPDVEDGFRQMKDRRVVGFSPMFHWTDQKIRVHAFYCVLALAVAHLMRRETARAGIPMSVRELLAKLETINEVTLLYQGGTGRPRARRMLTEIDPIPARLYDLFGLDAYAPAR
ncbi:MAG: IS1634 family transposase [Acidimicrobiales bacterium]